MFKLKYYIVLISLLAYSCDDYNSLPRRTGYPKIDFPKREYKIYASEFNPYQFVLGSYGIVEQDQAKGAPKTWSNIIYKTFNATIHLTYNDISSKKAFDDMVNDAHSFAYKHTTKADDIQEQYFKTKNRVSGLLYQIDGNTASSIQFFATDSSKHYLRGALYFNSRPNKDSIAPVVEFLRKDIDTLIQTLKWNN